MFLANTIEVPLLIIKYTFISRYLFTLFCPPNMLHFNTSETFSEFIFLLPVACTASCTCFLVLPQTKWSQHTSLRDHSVLRNQPFALQATVPLLGLISLIGILQPTSVLQLLLPGGEPCRKAVLATLGIQYSSQVQDVGSNYQKSASD